MKASSIKQRRNTNTMDASSSSTTNIIGNQSDVIMQMKSNHKLYEPKEAPVDNRICITPYDTKQGEKEDDRRAIVRSIYGLRRPLFDEYPDNFLFVKQSSTHGRGLFAGQYFRRRSRLCLYFGELISEAEADRRQAKAPDCMNYMYRLKNNMVVDAKNSYCKARFINHRCYDPNCIVVESKEGRLEVINTKPLHKGDELFIDYMMNYEGRPKILCRCASKHCNVYLDYCKKFDC